MEKAENKTNKQRLEEYLGKSVDSLPIALIYFDPEDGSVLKYNNSALNVLRSSTSLTSMPATLFSDLDKLSYVADRLRNHEEIEFYATYNKDQERFVPLTHISGASPFNVVLAKSFNALDANGDFLACGLMIRSLSESQEDVLYSDLEAEKYSNMAEMFGMTELIFHPDELTVDILGGRDKYQLNGVSIEDMAKIVHPDDVEPIIDLFADASVQHPDSIRFITRVFSIKFQGYRYFKSIFYPQIDSLGNVLLYGGYGIDITDEVIASQKKIEEAMKFADTVIPGSGEKNIVGALANISHDLRNPIGIIMGISEMMAQCDDPKKRERFNKTIQESSERILRMAGEILKLHKLESSGINIDSNCIELGETLRKFAEIYVLQFRSKGLDVVFEPLDHPVRIKTDEARLTEILDNYMSNALKYTKHGKVTIKYDDNPEEVVIHVIDTGKGISPEGCKRVFNRFERLDTNVKGFGIGLHISRGLADALGGTVGVDSKQGVGSDFWVSLPK